MIHKQFSHLTFINSLIRHIDSMRSSHLHQNSAAQPNCDVFRALSTKHIGFYALLIWAKPGLFLFTFVLFKMTNIA